MARVTQEEVKEIVNTSLDDLSLFIDMANSVVTEELAAKGMSEKRLTMIELLLSAHFLTLREREVEAEKFGDASEKYKHLTVETPYASSRFGYQAIGLDNSGTLRHKGNIRAALDIF